MVKTAMKKGQVIDFIFVLLIIIAIILVLFKMGVMKNININSKSVKIVYQTETKFLRQPSIDTIKEGQELVDSETNKPMGKIISKRVGPAEGYIKKTDGTYVFAEMPERYNLYLTIETSGMVNNQTIVTDSNRELNKNSEISLKCNIIQFGCKITGIEPGEIINE